MARPFQFDRDVVLTKAMVLFWENGYFNTSFDDIVDRLALSRSSIYNSFTDKRTLFIASLRHYIQRESRSLLMALQNLPPTPDSIRQLLCQVVQANQTGENPKGCLVVNSAIEFSNHDEEIRRIIENNVKEVVESFTCFIEAGQQLGHFTCQIKAEALAEALFHQITALRVTGKIVFEPSFFDNTIETFLQSISKSKPHHGNKRKNHKQH